MKLLIKIFSISYLAVLCILWASPYWPQAAYWLANLFQMTPLWALCFPAGFLFIIGLAVRDRKIIIANIGSLAVIVFCIMGFSIPFSAPGHHDTKTPPNHSLRSGTGQAGHLRIMTCNLGTNVDISSLSDFISRTRPDIIAFQEVYARNQNELEAILGRDKWNLAFQEYLGLASRLKIKNVEIKNRRIVGRLGGLVARYELEGSMGSINFFNLHLDTPRLGIEAIMDNGLGGLSEIKRVTELQEKESGIVSKWIMLQKKVLVAGDFNMPEANPIYRKHWPSFINAFSKAGFGFGYTKYTRWHGIRIDHLLCDGNWRVVHAETGPDIGSDHRPVIADVEFKGKSAEPKNQSLQEAPAIRKREAALPVSGSINVIVARMRKTSDKEILVSTGVPFGVGQLQSDRDIAFFDGDTEIPIATKILARWPYDNSIRSVLAQFRIQSGDKPKDILMKWGEPRSIKDIPLTKIDWELPEGFILLPAEWLCKSEVIGEQAPMFSHPFSKYDQNILDNFSARRDAVLKGDVREDSYYDIGHVFYQLYVRSGEVDYFKAARREAVYYRDTQVISEGAERGRTKYKNSRYIYVQAMVDDYLLTGDEKSLETAGYMAEYLKNHFDPKKAFFPKGASRFWRDREEAFPFLGAITYFELTGDKKYLNIASQYMNNLYKTQEQWLDKGSFIHNLYSHIHGKGARRGGSPLMTGLLLEPIVEYHRLTGSEIAKKSIFKALDWLIKEGLTDSFYYMTSDAARSEGGHTDMNLLIAHAFGYGYKISGYKKMEYLRTGKNIFQCGIDKASLGTRKDFNQNYRSSGHFLAYISDAPPVKRIISPVNKNMHPCLLFTKDSLPGLKEKFEKSPYWLKDGLLNYADVSPYWKKKEFLVSATDIYDIPSLGLAYQFFGDKDYAEQAIKNMLNKDIKNETDMENFALGFDWCYQEMTEQDKVMIVDKMEQAGLEMMDKKRFFRSFHNTMYQLTTSIAMCGYALQGESNLAQEFIKFAESQYQDAILMFNNIFVDGEWPEGMDYNRHIAAPMVKYFEVVKSATGKDLYKECDWLLKNAYFVLYTTQPDDTFYRFADNDFPEITDWERRFLVRVASYYQDSHIQWYVNNKTEPHSTVFKHIYDVLWYDPFLKEKSPEDLPRAKFFKGLGIVIARSSWDKSATWFSFKCGDYFGDHCHLDENSFTIHKAGDLAIDSGLYGDDFASPHWCNYYFRTIAHNTILVYNPTERFYGYKMASLANDGGQEIKLWKNGVRMAPENYIDSEPSLPVTWVKNKNKWETGEVMAYKLNKDYCYMSGDATKAYDFQKLSNFTRRILFIFPDYFIILDKVKSQRQDFKKKWVLHTVNEPGIKDNEIIITDKDGRLYCKALYPLNISINKVGGYGKEFLVNNKIYPHNGKLFQGNIPGSWRIEIEPLEPKNEDMFLNVLRASGINENKNYDIKKIESDNALGASIGLEDLTWVAIFNTGKDGRISYNIENKGRIRNLVFDLIPDKKYEIKRDGVFFNTLKSDENGMLDFEMDKEGAVEITASG